MSLLCIFTGVYTVPTSTLVPIILTRGALICAKSNVVESTSNDVKFNSNRLGETGVSCAFSPANGNCRATSHWRQHPDVLVYSEANVSHENWFYIRESWTSNYHCVGSQIYLPQFTTSWSRVRVWISATMTENHPFLISSADPTICSIYLFYLVYAFPLDILIRRK